MLRSTHAMPLFHWHRRRPSSAERRGPVAPAFASDGTPVGLDLLRADLYRILDALVRARGRQRRDLVREFERSWTEFKAATAARADPRR